MDDKMIKPRKWLDPTMAIPLSKQVTDLCAGYQITYCGVYQDQDAYALSSANQDCDGASQLSTEYPTYMLVSRDGYDQTQKRCDINYEISRALQVNYENMLPPWLKLRDPQLKCEEYSTQAFLSSLHWQLSHDNGKWLQGFVSLLIDLLPKDPSQVRNRTKIPADIMSLLDAAAYFIVQADYDDLDDDELDDTDEDMRIEREAREWSAQISFAAKANHSYLTNEAFLQYLDNGRTSVMTFEEAERYLHQNKNMILGRLADEADVQELTSGYLPRLRNLRQAVDQFISHLDLDQPCLINFCLHPETYQLNLRPLYEHFRNHYAYETALCILRH